MPWGNQTCWIAGNKNTKPSGGHPPSYLFVSDIPFMDIYGHMGETFSMQVRFCDEIQSDAREYIQIASHTSEME